LLAAPRVLLSVKLSGHPLEPNRYAWDGQTFWLNANIDEPTELEIQFGE
jgi:hypothetical protein